MSAIAGRFREFRPDLAAEVPAALAAELCQQLAWSGPAALVRAKRIFGYPMLIQFDNSAAVIEIPDGEEFAGILRASAFDWPFREASSHEQPVAAVRKSGERYELAAPDAETIEVAAASAACSVIVDAVKGYIAAHPSRLCLHCGSAMLNGRLVVFPGQFRAGKSTLVARLAAGGHTIFGDDVLPLDDMDECGVAMGIAPRLRVPLPASVPESFRAFAERHATLRDHRYHYLNPPDRIARRGTAAPLGAIVLLDRRAEGPAALFHSSRAAALHSLIVQNFSRGATADDLLNRMHALVERLPAFVLRYSELDAAAALLEEVFSSWPPKAQLESVAELPQGSDASDDTGSGRPPMPVGRQIAFRQNPSVRLRAVDGELFLADAEGWAIHHLNPIGAGVWKLLEQPITVGEALEVLHGAFPEVDRVIVEKDVSTLLASLHAEGFVIDAGQAANCAEASAAS